MQDEIGYEEEFDLEAIRGQDRKPKMAILNQKKVSKWEMDELFSDEDNYLEEC